MKNNSLVHNFVAKVAGDPRLGSWHLCLYTAMAYFGKDTEPGAFFNVTRKRLMLHSGIRSIVTYHKYLSELILYGYVRYQPSYDPYRGSQIAFII
jgi:hypothetical protein